MTGHVYSRPEHRDRTADWPWATVRLWAMARRSLYPTRWLLRNYQLHRTKPRCETWGRWSSRNLYEYDLEEWSVEGLICTDHSAQCTVGHVGTTHVHRPPESRWPPGARKLWARDLGLSGLQDIARQVCSISTSARCPRAQEPPAETLRARTHLRHEGAAEWALSSGARGALGLRDAPLQNARSYYHQTLSRKRELRPGERTSHVRWTLRAHARATERRKHDHLVRGPIAPLAAGARVMV